MDIATIGGLGAGSALLLIAIAIAPGSTFGSFIDIPSGLVVVGGATAAIGIAFPMKNCLSAPKVVMKVFFPKVPSLAPVIAQLVEFAELARRDGILALEAKTAEISDPFIMMGIQMAVDGTDAEVMEVILQTEIEALAKRHKDGKAISDSMGRYAPAFGMIGTLMGLIIMLGNMDDPEAIGPGMAVALITTLYGAIVSNLFFLPFSDKMAFYSKAELQVREVIKRGILSIQDGDNPRVLEQKLQTFLPLAERKVEEK